MTDHSARQAGLTLIREKLQRFEDCAGDDEGCDIGRDWFDALTTIGFLERTQRSPAMWSMTPAGESFLAAHSADARNGEGVALTAQQVRAAINYVGIHVTEYDAGKIRDRLTLLAAPAAPAPMEMALCEQAHLILKPGQLYRFTAIEGCEQCALLAIGSEKVSETLPVGTISAAPAPAAQDDGPIACDYCCSDTSDPWHGSGMLNGVECRHIHACDVCRHLLPAQPAPAAQADGDKRLLDLLIQAFGAHHPAIDDLASLILRANEQQPATPPECTCPSGNGSLRHPCPVHAAEPVSADYVLIPKVPTHDIRKAMHHAYWQTPHLPYHDGSPDLWNATYAALVEAVGSATPADAASERKRKRYTGDPQVEWDEFWKEIVAPDGVLDVEQVKKELADFSMLLNFVPKVYDHATGGAVTYPQTLPNAVISAIDNHVQDLTEEARKEGAEESADAASEADKRAEQIARQSVEEFKAAWHRVPYFADRVNKATREAITAAVGNMMNLPALLDQLHVQRERQQGADRG
jgi:hypothetical protein